MCAEYLYYKSNVIIDALFFLQEFMHHVGLYMAKERGAKIAKEVLFDAAEKI